MDSGGIDEGLATAAIVLATTASVTRGDIVVGTRACPARNDAEAIEVLVDVILAEGGWRRDRWRYRRDHQGNVAGGVVEGIRA